MLPPGTLVNAIRSALALAILPGVSLHFCRLLSLTTTLFLLRYDAQESKGELQFAQR
jgi:hypothetical protein